MVGGRTAGPPPTRFAGSRTAAGPPPSSTYLGGVKKAAASNSGVVEESQRVRDGFASSADGAGGRGSASLPRAAPMPSPRQIPGQIWNRVSAMFAPGGLLSNRTPSTAAPVPAFTHAPSQKLDIASMGSPRAAPPKAESSREKPPSERGESRRSAQLGVQVSDTEPSGPADGTGRDRGLPTPPKPQTQEFADELTSRLRSLAGVAEQAQLRSKSEGADPSPPKLMNIMGARGTKRNSWKAVSC